MECVYRAAWTCGGENWYSEANSSGDTPREQEAESQNRPRRAERTQCYFSVISQRYPEGLWERNYDTLSNGRSQSINNHVLKNLS